MSYKPDLKNPPKQIISEEEIYHQGRDNSNLIIGIVFGGVITICAVALYVGVLLDSISF
jgi:hypothetical protein